MGLVLPDTKSAFLHQEFDNIWFMFLALEPRCQPIPVPVKMYAIVCCLIFWEFL